MKDRVKELEKYFESREFLDDITKLKGGLVMELATYDFTAPDDAYSILDGVREETTFSRGRIVITERGIRHLDHACSDYSSFCRHYNYDTSSSVAERLARQYPEIKDLVKWLRSGF